MSFRSDHTASQELLAAYSLHAVDQSEKDLVSGHLTECPSCRREAAESARSASLLAVDRVDPPERVWAYIERQAFNDRRNSDSSRRTPVVSLAGRKLLANAAALVALVGSAALGATAATEFGNDETRQQAVVRSSSVEGAQKVDLRSQRGSLAASVVLLPDGRGYILDSSLPKLPPDKTYQLWAIMGQSAISAAVLGPDPNFTPFMAAGDVTALAITEERAGGVISSQNQPLVSAMMPANRAATIS